MVSLKQGEPKFFELMNRKRKESITILYSSESDGTVPMKLWKHNGGIAISRCIMNN